jgi:hypothetical protein
MHIYTAHFATLPLTLPLSPLSQPPELSSIESELETAQGHSLCSDTICTPGCHAFLVSLKDDLGCCWAELLAVGAKVMGADTLSKAGAV